MILYTKTIFLLNSILSAKLGITRLEALQGRYCSLKRVTCLKVVKYTGYLLLSNFTCILKKITKQFFKLNNIF